MRSQGRARLPFLLAKEPCTSLFPGQTGQGSSRVVAGAGAPHHLVDIRLTVPRSGGVAVAPAVVAILVIPGMGCRLDAAVISGCAGLAPSNVVSAVSTASTRVSNWSKPGATAGHRSSVLPQYSIPTVTPVIVNRHSAAARTLIPRITPATSTRATRATVMILSFFFPFCPPFCPLPTQNKCPIFEKQNPSCGRRYTASKNKYSQVNMRCRRDL